MAQKTRERVAALIAEGLSRAEVARRLGVSKPTVTYHCKRLGLPIADRCARRYDWAEVQRYHDAGHTARECMDRFGFSSATWHEARLRGDIATRPAGMPVAELLADPGRNRSHLKARLQRLGLLPEACERCGIREWLGEPVVLQLHHRNGNGSDNRLDNLQLLCPNCHSQTENWGGRNRRPLAVVEGGGG